MQVMAGASVRVQYKDDHGSAACALKVPAWQQAITGDALATNQANCNHLTERRHRFIRDDATGREYRVTVGDPALAAWTAAKGATVTGLTAIAVKGLSGTTFTYGGRTGERDLIRQ
jgi:hypothetical protein